MEIALGYNPKRSNGRKGSTVVTVQFVPMIAVNYDFPLWSGGQFEIVEEHIAGVAVLLAAIAISIGRVVVTVANVIVSRSESGSRPNSIQGMSTSRASSSRSRGSKSRDIASPPAHRCSADGFAATDEAIMGSR